MQYFFILGKNHLLSLAEIINLLVYQKKNFAVSDLSNKVLILDIQGEFSPQFFLARLGGTVKVGKIIKAQLNVNDLVKVIQVKPSGKINFGFSVYVKEENVQARRIEDLRFKIADLSFEIKKKLKELGRPSRFVVSREKNLSSVVVKTNKLIETGAEIVLLVGVRDVLIGQTLAVQAFEEYSSRDYGREHRDAKSGMIPPKLAKIMINLAGASMNGTILDPFCGSGTVLQEALLMGYQGVIGSDISEKAVNDSKKNLEWLMKKYQMTNDQCPMLNKCQNLNVKCQINVKCQMSNDQILESKVQGQKLNEIRNPIFDLPRPASASVSERGGRTSNFDSRASDPGLRTTDYELRTNYKLFQHDVQKISNIVGTNSIDAVVTEPYLGPSNLKHANIKRVSELGAIKKELSELYLGAFWEFKKVLKSGGRVVMVWPVWQIGANQWQDRVDESKLSYLPIIDQVIKLGFRKINLLPAELRQQSGIKLNERRSLIYSRPNQMVLREIMVFAKK